MARIVGSVFVVLVALAMRAPASDSVRASSAQATPPLRLTATGAASTFQYFIATGLEGSRFRPGDAELAVWALAEWERSAGGALRFEPADREEAARIRFRWLPFDPDAELGRMKPSIADGHVTASILVRPDEDHFRPSIRRRVGSDPLMRDVVIYFVCLHEIGHALGLTHSSNPRDIMWSGGNGVTIPIYDRYRHRLQSRDAIRQTSWLSSDDVARFKALWAR